MTSTLGEPQAGELTDAERQAAVEASDEARERQHRRHVAGLALRTLGLVLVIATAVVLTIGFSNSWWVQKHPVASSDQAAADGSSLFTQAGIDYFTRVGTVRVTMNSGRPAAATLGLASNGTKHLDFLVPLDLAVSGSSTLRLQNVGSADVITSGARISTIELPSEGSYASLAGDVAELAPTVGWSDADLTAFQAALAASRLAHDGTAYTATIGPVDHDGMRVSATLSASPSTSPTLVVRIDAAG